MLQGGDFAHAILEQGYRASGSTVAVTGQVGGWSL
jgi:hypothetical protein